MEGLLSTLKAAFTLKWSRRTTSANDRTAEVGGIKGDSNTVSIDQSVRPVVVNQPGQTKGDELRMEAIQAIWKATQEIKRTYTAAMFDIDLTYGDVPNDVLFAHPTYTEAKKSLQRDFDRLREIGNCKEYEPYVPSRLWNLFDLVPPVVHPPHGNLVLQGRRACAAVVGRRDHPCSVGAGVYTRRVARVRSRRHSESPPSVRHRLSRTRDQRRDTAGNNR